MMPPECSYFMDVWDGFRDGRLKKTESAAVEQHLSNCEACRLRFHTVEGIGAAVRDAQMNPFTRRRLAAAAADFRRPVRAARRSKFLVRAFVPIAFAAGVFAVFALFFGSSDLPKKPDAVSQTSVSVLTETAHVDESIETALFVDHGRRELELFPGTSLYLSADAKMETVTLSASEARFSLISGSVAVEIGGHEPNFRFVLSLPHTEAEARGTVFFARVDPNGVDEVQVLEGVVEVRGTQGESSMVVSSSEGVIAKRGALRRSSDLRLVADNMCLMKGCAPSKNMSPSTGIVLEGPLKPKSAPLSSAAQSALEEGRLDDAFNLVDELPNDNVGRVSAVQLLSRLARAYRSAKKFDEARNVYLRLIQAFPKTDAAADSLVALGQMEYRTLGLSKEALLHFNRYLTEHPAGVLAETAAAEKIRLLEGNGNYREVIAAADDYIGKYKDVFGLVEVRRRRADALARTGHCREAIVEYLRIVTERPGTSEALRAEKGIASCRR